MQRQNRIATGIAFATFVLVAVVLGGSIIVVPQIFSSASNTAVVVEQGKVNACRSLYSISVDEKKGIAEQAQSIADDLVQQGLAAVARGDDGQLALIAGALDAARTDAARAQSAVSAAQDERHAAVLDSANDIGKFLAECQRRFGTRD